jgi:type II secretory pathway component GspD/PulD (secretin)
MATPHTHSLDRRWHCRMLVGLLIALTAWTSVLPMKRARAEMSVAVHQGQLSVNLREVPVQEVLAAIGQQAGLRVAIDASAHGTVTAQFTDMALDQGLRRLLRAASLNYSLLYARGGSAATDILQEVRVFGEAPSEAPARHDRTSITRVRRADAWQAPLPPEAPVEPVHEAEPEEGTEPTPEEPEQDGNATQD